MKLVNKSDAQGSEILPDDFCGAMIAYFASFAAAKDQTKEAKLALLICTGIGLRVHIQSKTGWIKPSQIVEPELSPQDAKIAIFLAAARQAGYDQKLSLEVIADRLVGTPATTQSASAEQPQVKRRWVLRGKQAKILAYLETQTEAIAVFALSEAVGFPNPKATYRDCRRMEAKGVIKAVFGNDGVLRYQMA